MMHAPLSRPAQPLDLPASGGRFELDFRRHGVRTVIGRQFVSYPFHMTRGFGLDAPVPSMLTVYQQSSSGGLYRGDRMATRIALADESSAHVTTQSGTLVHDCHGEAAELSTRIVLGPDSYFAYTPDATILFPGAALVSDIALTLAPGAAALLQDIQVWHDPSGQQRHFDRLSLRVTIADRAGRLLARDRSTATGLDWAPPELGLDGGKLLCGFFLVGDPARLPAREALAAALDMPDLRAGVTALPNGCGWCVRGLAGHAAAARTLGERIFAMSFAARHGHPPAPRRK